MENFLGQFVVLSDSERDTPKTRFFILDMEKYCLRYFKEADGVI